MVCLEQEMHNWKYTKNVCISWWHYNHSQKTWLDFINFPMGLNIQFYSSVTSGKIESVLFRFQGVLWFSWSCQLWSQQRNKNIVREFPSRFLFMVQLVMKYSCIIKNKGKLFYLLTTRQSYLRPWTW